MSGGLTRRVVIASGVLLVIVAAAFAVLLVVIDDMRDSARQADHSQAELTAAAALERRVVDLESGARGFVITGEERFLGPWTAARRALPGESTRLVGLTDDAEQRRRAEGIARAVTSYLEDYSIPLVAAARRRDPFASSVAATAAGKRRLDAIRTRFDRFVATERALVSKGQETADDDARAAVIAASAGLAGSVILILLICGYLTRAIVLPVRRAARMANRLAEGDLGVRMPETGVAEIGELERAFNTMAGSLEASHADLRESRARVVAASDETRRRIERDLHDGTQQRLVSLGLEIRAAEAMSPAELTELRSQLSRTAGGLTEAVEELQEITRGIHPAILSKGGLGPALRTLARRSAIPVELQSRHRQPPPRADRGGGVLRGLGGAHERGQALAGLGGLGRRRDTGRRRPDLDSGRRRRRSGAERGSGLLGLKDRVESLGGQIELDSSSGNGTSLRVAIPGHG